MVEINLHLKETHMYQEGGKISPINYIVIEVDDNDIHDLLVIDGVVYAALCGNNYGRVLAPVKETPSELSANSHINLVELKKKE